MEIAQKLGMEELLSLYQNRTTPAELPQIDPLQINRGAFQETIIQSAERAFKISQEDIERKGTRVDWEWHKKVRQLLDHDSIEASKPITLVAVRETVQPLENGKKSDFLYLDLQWGEMTEEDLKDVVEENPKKERIAAMILPIQDGNILKIRHREVDPRFRRKGIGEAMLKWVEAYMGQKASFEQKTQKIEADTAQLDVICWLWNNEYRPKTEQDKKVLEKILSGSPDLCLGENNYIFPISVPKEKRNPGSMMEAMRVTLEKKIAPRLSFEIHGVQSEIRSSLKKIA